MKSLNAILRRLRWIPAICAAVMLLLASGQIPGLNKIQLPWEYFIPLMQWVVFVAAMWVGYIHYTASKSMPSPGRKTLVVLLMIVAVLFNPFVAVPVRRSVWVPIDIGATILFLVSLMLKVQGKRPQPSE